MATLVATATLFLASAGLAISATSSEPLAPGAAASRSTDPVRVAAGTVEPVPAHTLTLHGQVVGSDTRSLAFEQAGTVRTFGVERGEVVTPGQVLAELDTAALSHRRRGAQARLDELRAQRERVVRDLDRARRLEEEGASTAQHRDALEATLAQLDAGERGIAAELDELARQRREAVLRSPVHGEVSEVHLRAGTVTGPGQPVVTLRTSETLEAEVAIPQAWLTLLEPGMPVTVHLPMTGLEPRAGHLDALLDPRPGALLSRARLPIEAREGVRPGMRVVVQIEVPQDGMDVPVAALVRRPETSVWRVEDGIVQAVAVELIEIRGERALVRGALEHGAWVATSHLDRLAPGDRVRTAAEEGQR